MYYLKELCFGHFLSPLLITCGLTLDSGDEVHRLYMSVVSFETVISGFETPAVFVRSSVTTGWCLVLWLGHTFISWGLVDPFIMLRTLSQFSTLSVLLISFILGTTFRELVMHHQGFVLIIRRQAHLTKNWKSLLLLLCFKSVIFHFCFVTRLVATAKDVHSLVKLELCQVAVLAHYCFKNDRKIKSDSQVLHRKHSAYFRVEYLMNSFPKSSVSFQYLHLKWFKKKTL